MMQVHNNPSTTRDLPTSALHVKENTNTSSKCHAVPEVIPSDTERYAHNLRTLFAGRKMWDVERADTAILQASNPSACSGGVRSIQLSYGRTRSTSTVYTKSATSPNSPTKKNTQKDVDSPTRCHRGGEGNTGAGEHTLAPDFFVRKETMQVQQQPTVPPIAPELLPSALQCEDCSRLQPLTCAICPACGSTNLRQVATCCANEGITL